MGAVRIFYMGRGQGAGGTTFHLPREGEVWLWLDDEREPTPGWTWVKTVSEAKELMLAGQVTRASLDNDLGQDIEEGRKLVYWMCESNTWPTQSIRIHSGNSVAYDYMSKMILRYGPFTSRPRPHLFEVK